MSTKDKVLAMMERNRDTSLSGESIAEELHISRTAVWKAVKALELDGYEVIAVPRRGYRLSTRSDRLSAQGIEPFLNKPDTSRLIYVYPTLESTSKTAKEMAVAGRQENAVILAEEQTAGRGRFGRAFVSPPSSGLYISFLLRPKALPIRRITWLTAVAALAVCDAVKLVTGRDATIKWVNDVMLGGRKICGILTEAITDVESGEIDHVIVGIGINITSESFPPELEEIAGGLFTHSPPGSARCRLAASLMNTFLSPELWPDERELYRDYKARQNIIGRDILVHTPNESYCARAVDLDEECRLIVETPEGERVALSSGEVSIRM